MTKRQKHALDFIKSFWAEHGYSPSYEEIKEHLGLKSKSNVHFLVFRLVKRELIAVRPHMARSITVLDGR
jgi:SOS-response transcriptional repressor LexA